MTFSIVIPAHNESKTLNRLLAGLNLNTNGNEADVIVVVNGTTDDSAAVAASYPSTRLLEIDEASKTAALNAADELVRFYPVIYLDADIRVSFGTLKDLAVLLAGREAPTAGSVRLQVDTQYAGPVIQSYYRAWARTSYRRQNHIGSGIFALNEAGRRRVGKFPTIIADDRFVQVHFSADELASVETGSFIVESPRSIRNLIRRNARIQQGNIELRKLHFDRGHSSNSSRGALLRRSARSTHGMIDLLVFVVLVILSRLYRRAFTMRGRTLTWAQDRTTRS